MTDGPLAVRRFGMADQRAFAAASGDCNPMHLDTLAARRTQAGVPVVHGVNAMLWALDTWLSTAPDMPICGLVARFERFVAVDEDVALWTRPTASGVRLELRQGDACLIVVTVRGQAGKAPPPRTGSDRMGRDGPPRPLPPAPFALSFEQAATGQGAMPLMTGDALYPRLAARLGADRVRGMVGLSTLVGMIVPGLHSIFSSLDLTLDAVPGDGLAYRVVKTHEVFRLLDIAVEGPRFTGKVQAFVRLPPVVQPSMADLRGMVAPGSYAGVAALVVGGSRGLGEVTAKLLAVGGARVAISYVSGSADGEAVVADIRDGGGDCTLLRYDALAPAAPQLAALPFVPDQLYYFATSKIFLQKGEVFSPAVLADFNRVYVEGFADLCTALSASGDLLAFYPSSVAIDERPRAMTEYTMAKAAAEILCADMTRFMPRLRTLVRRLPRLLTDQTATVTPSPTPPAADVMHEVVTAMMAAR
jgi:hypothetical protein